MIVVRCNRLISPRNSKTRVYDPVPTHCALNQHGPLHLTLSGFRGFNVLPRGLLSRTWKQTSTLRVHAPLVLDEGQEKKLTTIGRRCRMCPVCVSGGSDPGVKYHVDLVGPLQRPPSPLITPQMPSRVRICGLSHHRRWPDESKRALRRKVKRSVTAQEGGVHKCVANGYSS